MAAITMNAVVQRVNRKLAESGETLKKYRGGRGWSELGDYYVMETRRNLLFRGHVNPEKLARELGVLKPWEEVAE